MIQSYKDRELYSGYKIHVYRNLNSDNLFSIRSVKTGLVLGHGDNFIIKNAVPYVSESGRKRVLDKKTRNVHAFLTGVYVGLADEYMIGENDVYAEVYYNPYQVDQFVIKDSGEPLGEHDVDFLFKDGKCYLIH